MSVLQIEHEVFDLLSWKKAFESDPRGRKKMGVTQYEIFCLAGNSNNIIVNFWFEDFSQAENQILLLNGLWDRDGGKLMKNPRVRILDMMDWNFLG